MAEILNKLTKVNVSGKIQKKGGGFMGLSVYSKIKDIYAHPQGRVILERYLPKLTRTPSFQMTMEMSFETLCRFRQWRLKPDKMAEAAMELEAIKE